MQFGTRNFIDQALLTHLVGKNVNGASQVVDWNIPYMLCLQNTCHALHPTQVEKVLKVEFGAREKSYNSLIFA
jgi:hypothetical protein